MKYLLVILVCLSHTLLIAQKPLTCQVIQKNSVNTWETSFKYEYDNQNRIILQNSYSGFNFNTLNNTTSHGYLGGLKNLLHTKHYDTLGNVIKSKKYHSTPNDDCTLDIKLQGNFGPLCGSFDIDTTISMKYIQGCENGWVDLINSYCLEHQYTSNWRRHSFKSGDFIKITDTILLSYTSDFTEFLFSERSYKKGKLVRKYHNITDVIGNNLTTYSYDEYGNLINTKSEQRSEGKLLFENQTNYKHTYKNDLLVETVSPYSITQYFYDDDKRLIKSEELSIEDPTTSTFKIYTYSNIFNENQNESNKIIAYPNPSNGLIQLNPSLNQFDDVKIYTSQGIEIRSAKSTFNYLDISSLGKGVYFLSAQKGEEKFRTKFIKI